MNRRSLLSVALLLVLAACGITLPASVTEAATTPPTATLPSATATIVPLTPTNEVLNSPVEFMWSIKGDPNALDTPAGLATDIQGNLYALDAGNNRIQVFDPDGHFVRLWGKLGNGPGEFNFLRANGDEIGALALDSQGNVYVADNANQRIQKFDNTGTFLLEWGSNGTGDGQFLSPIGVTVDQQGSVYVIDDSRDDVQKFDSIGTFLLKWGKHGSGDGEFNYPGQLEVDSQGNIFVADFSNHRVQKFDSQGSFLTKWGVYGKDPGEFNDPIGIAIDPQENVYVIEYAVHSPQTYRVQIFDGEGQFLGTWGSPGKDDGEFIHPLAIAVDSQGNIYVSDLTNRIQKFRPTNTLQAADPSGVVSKFESFPSARCCNGTPIEPGEYELPSWVGIPLTMEVSAGWQVVNEKAARLFMLGKGESIFNDPTQAFVFIAIPNENPQAILTSIKYEKGLIPEGEITEIAIAGFSGLQLDLSAKPNTGYEGDKEAELPPGVQFLPSVGRYFAEGFFWTTWSAEARLRFVALNVGDHVLLFQIDAPPAEFEAFASEADQVLQTLKLRR